MELELEVNYTNLDCDKCLILGKNIKGSNCYLETSFTKRTDIDFRSKTYTLHHNYDTLLSRLRIDMVTTFNVDYMHCVLLGITKKMIHIYLSKDKAITTRFKLSKANILEINLRLKKLEAYPTHFVGKYDH